MSKISKRLNLESTGKFELHSVLTSGNKTPKTNPAKERNKPEIQVLIKEYKNISNNVGKIGRFLD